MQVERFSVLPVRFSTGIYLYFVLMKSSAFGQVTASSTADDIAPPLQDRRPQAVLERLRNRLAGFALTDQKGEILGEVRDFHLTEDPSQRHFNIVFSPIGESGSALRLLHSRYLDRVEARQRSLITKLQPDQIRTLPEYRPNSAIANPKPVQSEQVQLLEERLQVHRSKRKVGEVVVRKTIETRMVEVPISREILIVEQVGLHPQRLAEIDLGSGEVTGVQIAGATDSLADSLIVKGQFATLEDAIQMLLSIAQTIHHRCQQVKIETLLDGGQKTYHELPTPSLASQLLQAIAPLIAHRCQQVALELQVGDRDIQKTYQSWFERHAVSLPQSPNRVER